VSDALTHIIFDLGGVIVKLRGTPIKREWFPVDDQPDDVWVRWLTSEAPRLFEAGKIDRDEFAVRVVDDLSLSTTPAEMMNYFSGLPESVFDGIPELLKGVRENYVTACFSNSNHIHWTGDVFTKQVVPLFDHHFSSHLMGVVKPDAESYEYVIKSLGVKAGQILFFDDNQMNVDAARSVGMRAERTVGFDALSQAIRAHNLV